MLCVPVFIFISGSSISSFRAPTLWFINLTVATCHIQCTFLGLCQFLHEKTDKTWKYLKSAIFIWYENGRRRLLGAQSINTFKRINSLEECLMSCRLTKMSESSISYWAVIMNNFYHGTVHCSSNIERYHYKYEKRNQNLQVQCKYWPKSFHALLQLKKNNTYQFLNWVSRKLFCCNCSMSRTK